MGRQDYETETLVTHTLRGDGFDASEDGTGRGTPLVLGAFGWNKSAAQNMRVGDTTDAFQASSSSNPAVAFDMQGREGGAQFEGPHDTANIRAASGGSSQSYVAHTAVRRLTPRECERLQGFQDDWTLVPYRGKPASDGPRYKAIGNSMAVPVMRWIGERIAAVDAITADRKAA
jgi:DNA (cytosine-5)-methyltransferase 1